MAQTLDQLNSVRRRLGQPELTELPGGASPAPENNNSGENEGKDDKNKNTPPATPAEIELDDEKVLNYLQSKKGISATSLDELGKAPEQVDPAKQAEDRENAKLTFGLNKGLFNSKTHEQFILDSSNKQNLVYAHYYQEAKEADNTLTDEEIQTEFSEKYGLNTDPGTRKNKRGQQEIELLADRILRKKYANIYKLDSEFTNYEAQESQKKSDTTKIKAGAPAYKSDVESVFAELKKITTKLGENEEYEVAASDEALTSLKNNFLDPEFASQKILSGYTKEELKEVAYTAFLRHNWPSLVKEIVNQALHAKQKGVKGIVPANTTLNDGGNNQLSEQQQKVNQRIFGTAVPAGAN